MSKYFLLIMFMLFEVPMVFAEELDTDVVVIVDTSVSMKEKGMDPNRVSLLVSKLLSDVVPGRLSFIRLLDLNSDTNLLPSISTGVEGACSENTQKTCTKVKAKGDWQKMAYDKAYGAIERPARGDIQFKRDLESHLVQRANNSPFELAFSSARGILIKRDLPFKYIIWLSDGKAPNKNALLNEIKKAKVENIQIEAIVFGAGDTSLPRKAGIPVIQTKKPADLMKAFANLFRKIVHAPYDIDNTITSKPSFTMLPNIKEAWIVVYGDDSLTDVSLVRPDGSSVSPNYAHDLWKDAGAYKVAHIENPLQGKWKVEVKGGGKDVAYAVVQNSSLYPFLENPKSAFLGVKTQIIVSIKSGGKNNTVKSNTIGKATVTASIDKKEYQLNDEGLNGDSVSGDGLFSGTVLFRKEGKNEVDLTFKNSFTNKTKAYEVVAKGLFSYLNNGTLAEIDFGKLKNNDEVCKDVILDADQKGVLPFELKLLDTLPAEHYLSAYNRSDKANLILAPKEPFKVCLKTGESAPSSFIEHNALLQIQIKGTTLKTQQVVFNVSWEVEGLSFLQRWLWLLLLIAAILFLVIIILGYVLPQRFQSTLHIAMGSDLEELEEFVPMQLKRMPKVGIGFYRNAQAFIHDDFRVSGKAKGASVKVVAEKSDISISAINGREILHKDLHQKWVTVTPDYSARIGEVIRIGNSGLYFKLVDM